MHTDPVHHPDSITHANTIVGPSRLYNLVHLSHNVYNLDGEVCEVGVYRGGTARLICQLNPNRTVLLVDTFEGLPQQSEYDNHHVKGEFYDTSIEYVESVLAPNTNYLILKSVFPDEKSKTFESMKFKFVHIDVDLHDSVYNCLDWFYPRMVPGGHMILDDYNASTCMGAKIATDRFIREHNLSLTIGPECQAFITIPN